MNRGVVVAQPGLRGGDEYGESWHEGGMRGNKQNVFDDFYASAEWLIKEGYTTSKRLVAFGGPLSHHALERAIDRDREPALADGAQQPRREPRGIQGKDAARVG